MSPHRPPSTPLARSRMSTTSQETIDTLLKSLKAHTRTLNAIFAQHTAEMAVLERLYYKGKNQHGASLLWQRVSEMRRYGKRLQAMDICGLPEALRATFYGEPTATTTKKLKGAWTHYPSASYFKWALRLLLLGKQLLEKSEERYQSIYHWCTVFMQNGAFLQLTVTLAAVVSRLNALSVDALDAVRLLCTDCHRAMLAVYPAESQKLGELAVPLQAQQLTSEAHPPSCFPAVATDGFVETNEDLGQVVERQPPSPSANSASAVATKPRPHLHDPHTPTEGKEKPRPPIITAPSSSAVPVVLKKRKDPSDQPGAFVPPQKKKKSKKKQRDEIDDIFS